MHLTEHIRRFGPAILFATEAFESFNAIIRAKSVHSNRHAPSRDIALAFAQGNRVRHLLSGGHFDIQSFDVPNIQHTAATRSDSPVSITNPTVRRAFSYEPHNWRFVGAGPRSLVQATNTVTHYLGLDNKREVKPGKSMDDTIFNKLVLTAIIRFLCLQQQSATLI